MYNQTVNGVKSCLELDSVERGLPGADEAFTAISRLSVEPRVGGLSVNHAVAEGEDTVLGDPTSDNTVAD